MMALSTTVPMARTSANNVSRFIENPAIAIKPNVPITDTKIANVGISVARMS